VDPPPALTRLVTTSPAGDRAEQAAELHDVVRPRQAGERHEPDGLGTLHRQQVAPVSRLHFSMSCKRGFLMAP
jgi:hypothetical protein